MKNIVLDWLNHDLKLNVTQKYVIGSSKNGVLIANILYKYKIINENILEEIEMGADGSELSNLVKLNFWMKLLGIGFSSETIEDLLAGKGSVCMQVMYQLYLSLNTKIYRKKLGDIIQRQREYNDWCEERESTGKLACDQSSNENLKIVMDFKNFSERKLFLQPRTVDIPGERGELKFSYFHKNCTSTLDESKSVEVLDHSKNSSAYISLVKSKLASKAGRDDMKSRLNSNIMNRVWNMIDYREKELDKMQCLTQTQTIPKLKHKSPKKPNKNKKQEMALLDNKRFEDKQQYEEDKEQIDWGNRSSEPNHLIEEVEKTWKRNFESKLDLHRKLWKRRVELQKVCRYNLCKAIIDYCINLAIKLSEESLKHEIPPEPKNSKGFEKLILSQSQPESSSEIPILNVSSKKYRSYHECSYNEYLYLTGKWYNENIFTIYDNFRGDGDNNNIVLGCIIYSLLSANDKKVSSSKLKKYPISCVVSNSPNAGYTRKCLQAALKKSSILVVDRETAIDYCKKIYLENDPHPPKNKSEKSKKGKKETADSKKSKKSTKNQSIIQKVKDEAVQVDGVLDADDLENLNDCIRNGQDVNNCLLRKSAPDNNLVVKCIVSVLKSYQNKMRGWVVVNFPSSLEETRLFENYLSGNLDGNTKLDNQLRNPSDLDLKNNVTRQLSSDPQFYYSSLLPNLSNQGQYPQNKYISRYISMLVTDKEPVEERDSEFIIRHENNINDLETHFERLGILQEFPYNGLDYKTIINLAHSIIAEAGANNFFEYFIDENALTLTNDNKDTRSKKSKKKNQKSKGVPEVDPFFSEQPKLSSGEFSCIFKPGDANWNLCDCSLANDMRQHLIQLWQLTETSYLNCLEKLFSSFHQIEEIAHQYCIFVEKKMKNILFNNTERNSRLQAFAKRHNYVKSPLNESMLMTKSSECDALTSQLLVELWNLSDLKRRYAEEIISRLLCDNTVIVGLMKNLWNILVLLMDVEFKRFMDTLILLQHYYLTVLRVTNIDPSSLFDEVLKKSATYKLDEPNWEDDKSIEMIISKNSDFFINTVHGLAKAINELREILEKNLYEDTSINSLGVGKIAALILEWKAASDYEFQRILFRLDLIKRKAISDIISMKERANCLHLELFFLVEEIFLQENRCCITFSVQIDEAHNDNSCLLGSFDFVGNEYYFRTTPNSCTNDNHDLENTSSKYFTLTQLEKIVVHLKTLAPSGKINRTSLSFLLDDWNQKTHHSRLLPVDWCNLTRQQIYEILELISGKHEIIEWKDFLLFSTLRIYPSKEELITQYRIFLQLDPQQLGSISFEDFSNNNMILFGSNEIDRLNKLLFFMFKTDENRFDYRSFLMKLCKDEDPAIGFGKALSLSYNHCVVVSKEDKKLKTSVEDARCCSLKIAKEILNQILLDVIILTECAFVYECSDWDLDSVPLWWKLGRLPITCAYNTSVRSSISAIERESKKINMLRALDWTNDVPSELFVMLLEEGSDSIPIQCSKDFHKYFQENCTRLRKSKFLNAASILSKDKFVKDILSKDTRFKAISLPYLINKKRNFYAPM